VKLRQRCLTAQKTPFFAGSPTSAANFVTNRYEALRYSRIGLIRVANPGLTSGHRVPFGINSPAASSGKAELASMLPGFRFLFAAIVLSMSVLVFGLGAAALLRAAHEQFASMPSRRAPPEPVFAQPNEPPMPTLALLRFEPPGPEKAPDNVPENAATIALPEPPATQTLDATPAEPEKLAALKPEEPAPTEPVKPEIAAAETSPVAQAAPAETPAPNDEVKLAAIAEPPPAPMAASTATEPVAETPSLGSNIAATKIATLGGPAVTIEEPASAKTPSAKPDPSTVKKRAARARERRRIAARHALLAQQAAAQQQANPFAQLPAVRRTAR
jgi:hypothetical protein